MIVGTGVKPDGYVETWVFVAPEPSSLGLAFSPSIAILIAVYRSALPKKVGLPGVR